MICYKQYVHLGPQEWGNALMCEVAVEFLRQHQEVSPLVVIVHEHGGWALAYALLDGEVCCVGSANDAAVYHGKAREFRERTRDADWHTLLPDIRRGAVAQEVGVPA